MEKHKICSFFGHREMEITEEIKQKVKLVIQNLIVNEQVSTFLFGSRSNFNYLCLLVVTELKENYPNIIWNKIIHLENSTLRIEILHISKNCNNSINNNSKRLK